MLLSVVSLMQAVLPLANLDAAPSHLKRGATGVFKERGTTKRIVPFVVVFESSSGSSWLLELLNAHPAVCAIGFEPIDNISMASPSDHESRIRWLGRLWSPKVRDDQEWLHWKREIMEASVFGQRQIIFKSLEKCDRARSLAFGLKARLSRLLSSPASIRRLGQMIRDRHVRVVRLSRRNRIKQALAEYNRLRAGLGQFVVSSQGGSNEIGNSTRAVSSPATGVHVQLDAFRRVLHAVERSRRLTARVISELGEVDLLNVEYESLLSETNSALVSISTFLRLPSDLVRSAPQARRGGSLRKATSDSLCEAILNYRQVCSTYLRTEYAAFFEAAGPGQGECSCSTLSKVVKDS